ncbi:hypothetical protein SAMN04515667_1227 [Formosa sp. Hel1_31_208]|uniref:hypothetical protein n=1 Tax=Formosa sp. Hel1_31_208 TaxID=1798225 RepID=UPI00087C0DED|nr:hypothetical protein [Formosa sp. Hel1_31_208]SDS02119.1 hypothetical protein SAMN04515667_1227 [Formosa sp. Hel1_31_208]
MLRKTMASFLMLAMVFTYSYTINAQESEDYNMWQNILFTPDNTQLKTLGVNMRKHNQTYHSESPYDATVYNITTGPNAGKMIWQMGSMMFKHNDGRPSTNGHDEDWRDNVMPYIKKIHTIEYWSQDDEKSNTSMLSPDNIYPIMFVRYFEVSEDYGYLMNNHFKRVSETIKAMDGVNPWGLYYNDFLQGDLGRHVATVGFMKTWAEMDEDRNFKATFEKLFGADQWQMHLDARDDAFTNRWDEIWVYNKSLSGK